MVTPHTHRDLETTGDWDFGLVTRPVSPCDYQSGHRDMVIQLDLMEVNHPKGRFNRDLTKKYCDLIGFNGI